MSYKMVVKPIASTVYQSYQVQTLHLIMLLQSTPANM